MIPANKEIPKPDDVVEIKYLYAFRGGSIFQPMAKTTPGLDSLKCNLYSSIYDHEHDNE
jgi:hypothetical protein